MGRREDGLQALEESIREYSSLLSGPNAAAAFAGLVLAEVQAASVSAESNGAGVERHAGSVAARLEEPGRTLGPAWLRAKVFGDLGRVYQRLRRAEKARISLDKSIAEWSGVKAPPSLQAKRRGELEAVLSARKMTR